MSRLKINPVGIAALPIAIALTLSALLPYFRVGDSFSEYSYNISGWSFFSTVDLLMALAVLLSGVLLVAALVPEVRRGRVRVALGGDGSKALELPLLVIPAAAVALLGALLFFLLMLRVFFPPSGLSQGVGLFFGAFLAVALVSSAVGAIVMEIVPSRTTSALAPPPLQPDPGAEASRVPGIQPQPGATPPGRAAPPPPPGGKPPPPAPGTRRG